MAIGAIFQESSFLIPLVVYSVIILAYAIFVWKFSKFISKKDIVELNLWKFIKTEEDNSKKTVALLFYIVEYIIVMPFLVFFWYTILSVFILFLGKEQSLSNVLIIGMALVASIRIMAYFNKNLAEDLAKLLPFNLLAIFLASPNIVSISDLTSKFSELPELFGKIAYYIILVVVLEVILRISAIFSQMFSSSESDEYEEPKRKR